MDWFVQRPELKGKQKLSERKKFPRNVDEMRNWDFFIPLVFVAPLEDALPDLTPVLHTPNDS